MTTNSTSTHILLRVAASCLLALLCAIPLRAQVQDDVDVYGSESPDTVFVLSADTVDMSVPQRPAMGKAPTFAHALDTVLLATDSVPQTAKPVFNPDPKRAMWLSVLCPGLGQVYNRRYWKIPIVIGAFVGLGYGTAWNNRMLNDYSKAYRDLTDNDPDTRSYMDFFPPTTQESSLDRTWLQKTLKSRKDYYRRYRDICIIAMAAVYLINVVDAYVDASMLHFDVSPDLSMKIRPAVLQQQATANLPAVGIGCSLAF